MYVPVQNPPPSPQAQDLGQRIASTVRVYLAENPGIGKIEVIQAFQVARQLLRSELGGLSSHAAVVIGVLVGLMVLGVVFSLYLGGGAADPRVPLIAMAAVVLAIGGMVAVIAGRDRR
jgi:hypothetical protein